MHRTEILKIILLLLLTGSTRIACIHYCGIPEVRDDAALYSVSAEHISLILKGYPPLQPEILGLILRDRGPMYPFVLGCVFLLFGRSVSNAIFLQVFLDCLSTLILYKIGNQLKPAVGFFAALLFGFSIPNSAISRYVMTEPLTTFLMLVSILLLLSNHPFKTGIAGTLTYFTRPALLLWPLIVVMSAVIRSDKPHRKSVLLRSISGCLLTIVILFASMSQLPKSNEYWSVRSAVALYHGYNMDTEGWGIYNGPGSKARPSLDEGLDQLRASLPFNFLQFSVIKVGRLWKTPFLGHDIPWMPDQPSFPAILVYWSHWIFLLLACMALPSAFASRDRFPFAVGLTGITTFHALTYAIPRYTLVVLPVVYLLISAMISERIRTKKEFNLRMTGAILFLFFAVTNRVFDERPVEWIPLVENQAITQTIEIPHLPATSVSRIRLDLRLLQPGSAFLRIKDGDGVIGDLKVTAEKPWESPLWGNFDWIAQPGKHDFQVELLPGSSPVAISKGDMTDPPGDLLSYERWSVMGDGRIRQRNKTGRTPGLGVFVEIPARSGQLIQ